jgi:hypothetical protein
MTYETESWSLGNWGLRFGFAIGVWNLESEFSVSVLGVPPLRWAIRWCRSVVVLCNCAKEAGDENWRRIETFTLPGDGDGRQGEGGLNGGSGQLSHRALSDPAR